MWNRNKMIVKRKIVTELSNCVTFPPLLIQNLYNKFSVVIWDRMFDFLRFCSTTWWWWWWRRDEVISWSVAPEDCDVADDDDHRRQGVTVGSGRWGQETKTWTWEATASTGTKMKTGDEDIDIGSNGFHRNDGEDKRIQRILRDVF